MAAQGEGPGRQLTNFSLSHAFLFSELPVESIQSLIKPDQQMFPKAASSAGFAHCRASVYMTFAWSTISVAHPPGALFCAGAKGVPHHQGPQGDSGEGMGLCPVLVRSWEQVSSLCLQEPEHGAWTKQATAPLEQGTASVFLSSLSVFFISPSSMVLS